MFKSVTIIYKNFGINENSKIWYLKMSLKSPKPNDFYKIPSL